MASHPVADEGTSSGAGASAATAGPSTGKFGARFGVRAAATSAAGVAQPNLFEQQRRKRPATSAIGFGQPAAARPKTTTTPRSAQPQPQPKRSAAASHGPPLSSTASSSSSAATATAAVGSIASAAAGPTASVGGGKRKGAVAAPTSTRRADAGIVALGAGEPGNIANAFSFLKESRHYVAPTLVARPAPPATAPATTAAPVSRPVVPVSGAAVRSGPGHAANSVDARGSSITIIVNKRQEGNPVLTSIRNVPWEYGDIAPDFLMGQSTAALYLSLRYHSLHPDYIHGRLRELARAYKLRVLLVVKDIKNNVMTDDAIRLLSKVALNNNLTMILAMTTQEAGRYLETYKLYENKTDEQLQGVKATDYLTQLRTCLTTVRSVNKTDCVTMLSTFGSLADIMKASADDLRMCPGFGEQKADRIRAIFDAPFKIHTSNGSPRKKAASPKKKA